MFPFARFSAALLMGLAVASWAPTARADCEQPSADDHVRCLSAELRTTDERINTVYGQLREGMGEEEKLKLRNEQRAWLRRRDDVCKLDRSIADRETWFRALEADTSKLVCVVRFTTARIERLEAMKGGSASANTSAAATGSGADEGVYELWANRTRTNGKWYFEVEVEKAAIAKHTEMALSMGFRQSEGGFSYLIRINRRDLNMKGKQIYAVAIDLDGGFLYFSENGEWRIKPGMAGGMQVGQRTETWASVASSDDMAGLLADDLIDVNFGQRPFLYPVPHGYQAVGSGFYR